MFRKLLKYDMRATVRIWWIIAVSVVGVSLFGALALRTTIENIRGDGLELVSVAGVIVSALSIIAVASSFAITAILVYYRFYKNLFSDEGYLTFTLPVSRSRIILAKTANAMLWLALHSLLLAVCASLFFLISPPAKDGAIINPVIFKAIGNAFSRLWKFSGAWSILYILLGLLLSVCFLFFSVTLVQFCITAGAIIAKKHKLLLAIVIYYLVNSALSFVSQILFTVLGISFADGMTVLGGQMSHGAACVAIALALLVGCAAVFTVSAWLYMAALGKVERRLNLA